MKKILKPALSCGFLLFLGFLVGYLRSDFEPNQYADMPIKIAQDHKWEELQIHTPNINTVHASFIVETKNNEYLIFWFGGSKEGARDVEIYRTRVSVNLEHSPVVSVMSPEKLSKLTSRYVKNIGNPVVWYSDSFLNLALVNVSVGGWATARVDILQSNDDGENFFSASTLRTSPFFNISTLARTRPVIGDKTTLLPLYFELNRFNPMMVYVDESNKLVNVHTLPVSAIQSEVVVHTEQLQLFSRPHNQGVLQIGRYNEVNKQYEATLNGTITNDSSAVALVKIGQNKLLMAHNPAPGRGKLLLSYSDNDGITWRVLKVLEDKEDKRYSYPSMILGNDGYFYLTYTNNRKHISLVRFSLNSLLSG